MDKVLIAYATWAGATHEVANEIAKVLEEKNFEAVVASAGEIKSISEYQTIILGSSIHASKTVKGFNQFLKRFHNKLDDKPIALFVVCANLMNDCEKNRTETLGWLKNTIGNYPDLKPISIGLFGGALLTEGEDFKRLNFMFRKLIESMKENVIKEHGKSDFRDLTKIHAWAEEVTKKIKAK